MNYYELNQEQAKNYLSRKNMVAILPIGAIEVHGDHLPLDTDCRLAMGVAKKLEERLGIENCAIHIPDEILSAYLYEIAKSLERAGVKQMVVINSHMGNGNAIKTMARRAYESLHIKVYYFTYPRAEKVIQQVCTSQRPHKVLFHADEIETSYMLYLAPEAVDMGKAISQDIEFPEDYEYTSIRWSEFMEKAVLGDATAASAEKGKRIIDEVIEEIVAVIKGAS